MSQQPAAVADATARTLSLFQARILVSGLKFEAKTGMKMSSKVNSKRIAAQALGLPTRTSYEVLIKGLEDSIAFTEEQAKNQRPIEQCGL